jgi:hypothetical protein
MTPSTVTAERILRELLERLTQVHELADVNIAAGIALEELASD